MVSNDKFLTLKEIAYKLDISMRSVYRLVSSGNIPAKKVGGLWRVDPVKFEAYLKADSERKHANDLS